MRTSSFWLDRPTRRRRSRINIAWTGKCESFGIPQEKTGSDILHGLKLQSIYDSLERIMRKMMQWWRVGVLYQQAFCIKSSSPPSPPSSIFFQISSSPFMCQTFQHQQKILVLSVKVKVLLLLLWGGAAGYDASCSVHSSRSSARASSLRCSRSPLFSVGLLDDFRSFSSNSWRDGSLYMHTAGGEAGEGGGIGEGRR